MKNWECRICGNKKYEEKNGLYYCAKCGLIYKFLERYKCVMKNCVYNDGEYCNSKNDSKIGCYQSNCDYLRGEY